MNDSPVQPLYVRAKSEISRDFPFEGDLFERNALATRLTQLLERLPDGGVIAIDAPWGEGKTWFGNRWHATLVKEGFRSTIINCFEHDYLEDPFLMIAGELLELNKARQSAAQSKLLEASKRVTFALLPAATKLGINALGRVVLGTSNISEDLAELGEKIQESAAEGLEKLVSKRLEEFEANKKNMNGFRKTLEEMAAEQAKPIVIFLDELDRCRPDFAVRTLERIKHFFDVPGIVFVLLMNKQQLAASVEGIYGPINADAYLGKFIQLSLTLPKRLSFIRGNRDDNRSFCEKTLERFGFTNIDTNHDFSLIMGSLATYFSLSLRDIERAVVLYSIAQPLNASSAIVAWPIALKLADPDLFRKLIADDITAHQKAASLCAEISGRVRDLEATFTFFIELHGKRASLSDEPYTTETRQFLGMLGSRTANAFLAWIFERVDLAVKL